MFVIEGGWVGLAGSFDCIARMMNDSIDVDVQQEKFIIVVRRFWMTLSCNLQILKCMTVMIW